MRSVLVGLSHRSKPEHALTVWARDWPTTAWAWSCSCGTRFRADLASQDAARAEGRAHQAAQRGPVIGPQPPSVHRPTSPTAPARLAEVVTCASCFAPTTNSDQRCGICAGKDPR
jgi:hypothetical protein